MLRTILKPLSFVPALIMMYIIFSFSAQDGDMSGQLSYQASVKIIETADYVFNANLSYDQIDEWANKIDFITRKLAHMTEYFALAIAVSFPLYVYGLHGILLMFLAGLICVGFACGDEFHQSFIAGRSPSARDVCIDSVGVFFGIIVVRIIGWTGRKTGHFSPASMHASMTGRMIWKISSATLHRSVVFWAIRAAFRYGWHSWNIVSISGISGGNSGTISSRPNTIRALKRISMGLSPFAAMVTRSSRFR